MVRRFLLLAAVIGLGAAFVAPAAHAAFGIEKWESLTCTTNVDTLPPTGTVEFPIGPQPGQCRETSPDLFTQAAGHPNFGVTDFTLNTYPFSSGIGGFPEGFVKDIVVNTPEGLSVNPEATPKCTVEEISKGACPNNTIVGINYLTIAAFAPNPKTGKCEKEKAPEGSGEFEALPLCPQARVAVPVYNMVPFNEVPSMVAFLTETGPTFIVGSLSPVDQHVTFTISNVHAPAAGPPKSPPIVGSRLVFFGGSEGNINPASNGTYLTMPSNCAGPQVSKLNVDSYGPPYAVASIAAEKSFATPTGASGCDKVPFNPEIKVSADGPKAVDSPEAATVDVGIPFDPTAKIANSYLKVATVTLPEGMGINPSVANGLETCTEAQFGYHTANPITCPASSQIGTVEVQTPSLPANSLGGEVFIGAPLKNGPGAAATGEQFRILIHAFSARYGVNVRLKGTVVPNPITGQLTATVAENPQATFRNFRLHFFGGSRGVLTSPNTCGNANTTTTTLAPWSGQANATPSSSFALTSYPGGGTCPTTLASRPFAPTYSAGSDNIAAGQYSPFRVVIARNNGQQELKVVNVTLPKGLTAKLAGTPYCSEAAIAATEAGTGTGQKASPSCPAASRVGGVTVNTGTGTPFKIEGSAYLAGPYKGAPLSLVISTPAVAGPYDLGTVLVRVALNVNPETAQINAVSDPIPNVFGGVKLDIRSIVVNVDKSSFMLNPTNCSAQATAGVINGGGANPANPALFSSYSVSAPYQATGCKKLNFKPKFNARLYGPTKRNTYPRIRAIVSARKGDANIARTALTLPHSLFLEQGHIGTICTRPQLAAQQCPAGAVYGHAEAKSPLLENKLKGPVYLVSSNHTLPDLVADLRGQVNIQLRGVISSKRGGLKTVFNSVPDVPVSKFILNMRGGKKSLLVNSTNTCSSPQLAVLNMKGQNGKKVVNNKFRLNISSCQKSKGKKNHKK